MPGIFIWIVQAIIVSITDVYPWDAVAIITSKQVTEASATFTFAVFWGFIGAIATIVISIAVPRCWDTTVIWTPKKIGKWE